jgi:hypothetical protein
MFNGSYERRFPCKIDQFYPDNDTRHQQPTSTRPTSKSPWHMCRKALTYRVSLSVYRRVRLYPSQVSPCTAETTVMKPLIPWQWRHWHLLAVHPNTSSGAVLETQTLSQRVTQVPSDNHRGPPGNSRQKWHCTVWPPPIWQRLSLHDCERWESLLVICHRSGSGLAPMIGRVSMQPSSSGLSDYRICGLYVRSVWNEYIQFLCSSVWAISMASKDNLISMPNKY